MLTGKELGAAIEAARLLKRTTKKELAAHFKVSQPSVQDWVNRGTIDKAKLPGLWEYFSDVVGPEHWGLSVTPAQASATRYPDTPASAPLAMEPPPGVNLSARAFSLGSRLDALPEEQRKVAYALCANVLDQLEALAAEAAAAPRPPTRSTPRAARKPSRQTAR